MAISKDKKKEIYKKVSDLLDDSKSVAFASFSGLTVSEVSSIRRSLRVDDVGYVVVKKKIAKKVLGEKNITGTEPKMEGQVAFVYSKDLIAPARGVFEASKKYDKKITLVGGIFEGRYMSKEEITSVASIPPLQTLYGQFVNLINSPIQGLVLALDAIAKSKPQNN